MNRNALFYRDTNITYENMLKAMRQYAFIFDELGIKKDDEVPVLMSNCPELVYVMGAFSILGAKLHLFSEHLPKACIKQIFDSNKSHIFVCTDDKYGKIDKQCLEGTNLHILFSLADSLPGGVDPYLELDKEYYDFKNRTDIYKLNDCRVMTKQEFEAVPVKKQEIDNKISAEDEFIISYSTGSTGTPKPIIHTVKSLVAMGRWHDKDINGSMSIGWMTVLDHIYSCSNTGLIGSLSDGLLQGCKVALEPIFEPDHLINAIIINKPHYLVESRSFWLSAANKILYDEKYKDVKMPYIFLAFSVGEPLTKGEEYLINKMLRKVHAGRDVLKTSLIPIKVSVAGGSCEHGGIFFVLFRSLRYFLPYQIGKKDPHGMGSYPTVEYAVLDSSGHYCANDEVGELVVNSTCTMKGYKGNQELTDDFFVTDAYGKSWARFRVLASIDSANYIHIRSRMGLPENIVPMYILSELFQNDKKNILSCEITASKYVDKDMYLVHIEPQRTGKSAETILMPILKKIVNNYGKDVLDILAIKMYPYEGLNIQNSGKRNYRSIANTQIDSECYVIKEVNGTIRLISIGDV